MPKVKWKARFHKRTKKLHCELRRTLASSAVSHMFTHLPTVTVKVHVPADPYAEHVHASIKLKGDEIIGARVYYDGSYVRFDDVRLQGLLHSNVIREIVEAFARQEQTCAKKK